ncbi:hypothetical protein AALP_AA6G215200 [Arabis alpina]|uniref:Hydroxyproline-rich glycoprotein family protein n=1 Tax=Arabis alpina TaxID=50452 RepID=A0A087GQT3_ARAAL|nr:hypothetical protein AALP_AA6G215200 [Arabis alpina]
MSSGRLCGFTPITFCRKLSRLQVARGLALKKLIKGKHEFGRASTSKKKVENKKNKEIKRTTSHVSSVAEATPKSFNSPKQVSTSGAATPLSVKNEKKKVSTPRNNNLEGSSPKCTANFILMVELRKNIFAFREMIDLPPLDGSLSVTEIITHTMKDLQKLSPEIVTINKSFEMEGAEMDKMLIFFYEDLRAIGDSWIMDSDWIFRSKYKNSGVGKNKSDRLVEHVLAALDGLIKMTKERFGMMDIESDGRKSFTSKGVASTPRRSFTRSVSYSESNNSFYPSPFTPRSVLPGSMMMNSNSTSPSLWNLRAQALDKLSPVDLKRFAMQILSNRDSETDLDLKSGIDEEKEECEKLSEEEEEDHDSSVSETEHKLETEHHSECSETEHHETETEHPSETEDHSEGYETEHHEIETEHHSGSNKTESSQVEDVSMTPSPPPPPPPPPRWQQPIKISMISSKATLLSQPPPPPPPSSPQPEPNTPPPPPPPSKTQECNNFCPFPKPQSINGDNSPKMPTPPAPPGSGKSLRAKKATSKLRRSAQIANLYWVLKGKLEGRGVEGKSSKGQKNVPEKSPVKGARSGMADALAEMTKRSSYFQQIEEDVQKYAKSIEELKSLIQSFQTKDMKELLEFHSKVESVLEKLTDETQVLARFEGFPEKKLEAIRTAGALYKKLDGILTELKNWKIEPPINDLLDKIERYFNKVKGEIETVDRTKDEEAKLFQRYNINIDFEVLVQVKETMVDVSSNCMELALKERREANEEAKNYEESKVNNIKAERSKRLWRAFQFAFKVYTFAGGHDERADTLTRQLAHEIQTDPDQTDSSITI